MLDLVCVQEPEDVARWQAIGVERQCIEVVGSIKFDPSLAPPDPEIPEKSWHAGRYRSRAPDFFRRQHAFR